MEKQHISRIERGVTACSIDLLPVLSVTLQVSTDYLLGVTDNRVVDISGLTEHEATLICELVEDMTKKNENLFSN